MLHIHTDVVVDFRASFVDSFDSFVDFPTVVVDEYSYVVEMTYRVDQIHHEKEQQENRTHFVEYV